MEDRHDDTTHTPQRFRARAGRRAGPRRRPRRPDRPRRPAGLTAHAAPPAHPASGGTHHKKGGHDAGTTPLHAHGQRMRQFQGTVAAIAGDAVTLQLQGHQDVTATVTISETLTPGALAALAPGERVHIAAVATGPAGDAYVAVRVVIGRRAFGDTDKKTR